jgi:hypothetical protein
MPKLPSFEKWFLIAIAKVVANGEVSKDVISINIPPSDYTTTYWSMSAFGDHFWVASAKQQPEILGW